MESITMLSHTNATIAPPLPTKIKSRNSTTVGDASYETNVTYEIINNKSNCGNVGNPDSELTGSKTVSSASTFTSLSGSGLPLSSSSIFIAGNGNQPDKSVDNSQRNGHVVTIQINPDNSNYTGDHNKENNHHNSSIILNESKENARVKVNQTTGPINTIGKFIVNICESTGPEEYQLITNHSFINAIDKTNDGCVRINLSANNNKDQDCDTMKTAINAGGNNMSNPYFFCSSFPYTQNSLIPSGQCSPSDTLDSGTCSDLDGTPPPLPKKKLSKVNGVNGTGHKLVSVTVIGSNNTHDRTPSSTSSAEVDSEDNESNISCDSLNSSELSGGSLHEDANTYKSAVIKSEIKKIVNNSQESSQPPVAPKMPSFINNKASNGFLPQGLLQDIRERSAKLSAVHDVNSSNDKLEHSDDEIKTEKYFITNCLKPDENLTSFKLVSQINNENRKPRITDVLFSQSVHQELNNSCTKNAPIVNESTYEDRKLEQQEKLSKQDQVSNGKYIYDTDQYYDFHLNENVFDNECDTDKKNKKKLVNGKNVMCNNGSSDSELYDDNSMECFAGVKDFKAEEGPATIKSAKGTIRGVKNRVRAGIATFLQMQNSTVKSYKDKDAGKVVLYSTSMGIVRGTYQQCVLVKKILRNLLIKFEERDVFMSGEYQEEIKDRMRCTDVLVPQLFIDGHHIGDAETVERLNESGELRRMLKPYKSADACNTCQVCGGYRLLPCQVCSGSKKSVHRNHFTTEFVALKCMNCDEVGLVKCEACKD